MDWSLVLASQGIESWIESGPEERDWTLRVQPGDYARAVQAVSLYEQENRHWRWRRQVLKGDLVFDWTALLWVLLIALFFAISDANPPLKHAGLMDPSAVGHGQVWRLFTAMWLHADLGHLSSNAALGIVLLGLAMGRYGGGVGILAAYLAGFGGNLAVWLLGFGTSSLGASGLVMGCLGLITSGSWRFPGRSSIKKDYLARTLIAGTLLFFLLGLSPQSDFRAHAGGFVSGVLLGALINLIPPKKQTNRFRLASAFVFAALVIVPWSMVFKQISS